MADNNTNAISVYVNRTDIDGYIKKTLGDRAKQFTASLIAAANNDKSLVTCKPKSVVTAAMAAASLDLPINSNLGFAYLIPYKNKIKTVDKNGKTVWAEETVCQFQMGYKGFIQLAQRSGLYKTINVTEVHEGEIASQDRLSGEIEFAWIDDDVEREKKPVVGYVAYFRLLNGFEKVLYWTKEKCEAHAKKYSKNYAKYGSGLWKDAFGDISMKTVLKLLISKYGPLNTQLQEAIIKDQTIDNEYDDNPTRKPELSEAQEAEIAEDADRLAEELEGENGD